MRRIDKDSVRLMHHLSYNRWKKLKGNDEDIFLMSVARAGPILCFDGEHKYLDYFDHKEDKWKFAKDNGW